MDAIQTKLIAAGALFLGSVLSGIWLSNSSKPYPSGIFTIHKLVAVAAVLLIALCLRSLYAGREARSLLDMAAITAVGAIFAALIVTGALLSLNITLSGMALSVHQIAPLLALLASTLALFVLIRQVVETA